MRGRTIRSSIALTAVLAFGLAACGSDGDDSSADTSGDRAEAGPAGAADASDVPTIVVTTNILGDVVEQVVGDAADVVTIMPVGADPHDFQPSAQEVDTMMSADALIVNGEAFEESLIDVIESAEDAGVPTFEAISVVDTIEFGEGGHDEHSDEVHSEEEGDVHSEEEGEVHSEEEGDVHSDEEGEVHSDEAEGDEHPGTDPHFFTDPVRMTVAVDGLVDFLQDHIEFADPTALEQSAATYVAELTALDSEVEDLLGSIPEERRVLVTNHEVFGYFADRYGFEVVGAVIPAVGTTEGVSASELAELAEVIEAEGVPAIFSDTSSSDELIQTLAAEVGDVDVVALYTESLGDVDSDGATYVDMMRTNAERISSALG